MFTRCELKKIFILKFYVSCDAWYPLIWLHVAMCVNCHVKSVIVVAQVGPNILDLCLK